jgi:[ribosomal protein S5]-alanine N-acetyltransferase
MRVEDADALIPAWCDPDVARFMDDFGPRTPDQVLRWVREAVAAYEQDANSFGWTIELLDPERVIGWIGFGGSARGVGDIDFAYVIAPAWRGNGYATAALEGVISFCFEVLGVESVWGECAVDNAASAAVMRRVGMRGLGTENGQLRFLITRR